MRSIEIQQTSLFFKGIASQSDQKDLTQFLTWMSHSIWMNDDETTRDVKRWIVGKSSQNCQRFEEYGVRISTGHVGGFPYSSMKEILDHLERTKPWKEWDKLHSLMQIFRTVQQQYGQNSHNGWWNMSDSLQFVPTVSEIHTRCKKQEKPQPKKQNNKYKIIPPTPRLEVRTAIAKAIWGRKISRSPFWKTTVKLSKRRTPLNFWVHPFSPTNHPSQHCLHSPFWPACHPGALLPKTIKEGGKNNTWFKEIVFSLHVDFHECFQTSSKSTETLSSLQPYSSLQPSASLHRSKSQASASGFAKVSVNS